MTSTQIQYWSLGETKTHNRATEAQAAKELEETITHNRNSEKASMIQAKAAKKQAKAAMKNANTNRKHLNKVDIPNTKINRKNANTNRMNALTNSRNADINAKNAATNARNAATNAYNAETNRLKQQQEKEQIMANIELIEANTNFKKKELQSYDRDMVMKNGPDWAKNVTAADYLASIINDPNAASGLKEWAKGIIDEMNKIPKNDKSGQTKFAAYMNRSFGSNDEFTWKNIGGTLVRVRKTDKQIAADKERAKNYKKNKKK